MTNKLKATIVAILVVGILIGIAVWRHAHNAKQVTVDGTIECDEVAISSKVPGALRRCTWTKAPQ